MFVLSENLFHNILVSVSALVLDFMEGDFVWAFVWALVAFFLFKGW